MKNIKLKILQLILVVALASGNLLSSPLSGTYTIGGTSPNYATFTAAVNDLLANGVSGPVTFNARTGTYTESAISFTNITGSSATNTITFESETGVSSDVTLQTGITFTAASFITINELTMTYNGIVINLVGKSNNISIINNILTGPVVSSFTADVIQAIGFTGSNLLISGNTINNGGEGICLYGTDNSPQNIITNAIVRNNIVQNFYGWGITANFQKGTLIEGNTFTTAPTTGYGSIPIYIQNIMYPICVVKNKITLTGPNSGIAGMYIVNNHPDSASEGSTIANNMISIQHGSGLECANNDYFKFYYNTVYIISSGTCFTVGGNSTGNVLADNIFYQGSAQTAISGDSGAISSCDYNDIYTTSSMFGNWNGSNCSSFASWKSTSGMDAHSQSLIPSFTSNTNLHLTNYVSMQFGTPVPAVPDDIDGDSRNSTPAVGADDNGSPYTGPTNLCCSCGPQLAVAFTGAPTSICAGSSVAFTDQSTNSPNAWKWTFAGGIPGSATTENPTVVYDTTGTYNVKLVVTNATGTDSLTKQGFITVTAIPSTGVISANPDTVCSGNSVQLTTTGSTDTLQWQLSSTANNFADIVGADSSIYTTPPLSQTSSYRVVATSGNCSDTSAHIAVIVNPSPAPPTLTTNDSLICNSDSTLIQAHSGAPLSYKWNDGDTGSFTYAKQARNYRVTGTDANGCTAVSGNQSISVYAVPSVSIDVQGDTLSSFNSSSYQWYFNDDSIPGANTSVYIAHQSGNYSVQILDSNGCTTRSSNTPLVVNGIVNPIVNSPISIYPDPFVVNIFIKLDDATIGPEDITICDVLGRALVSRNFNTPGMSQIELNVSFLPKGIYCIKVRTKEAEYIKSVIKQ